MRGIKQYPDKYLFCRAFRAHRWKRWTPPAGMFRPRIGVKVVQRCECGMVRHRNVTRATGEWLDAQWQYKAPRGYRTSAPATTQDFRREYVSREYTTPRATVTSLADRRKCKAG
jgi:hypothetical protein